jgi:hypothetical protein
MGATLFHEHLGELLDIVLITLLHNLCKALSWSRSSTNIELLNYRTIPFFPPQYITNAGHYHGQTVGNKTTLEH